MHDLHMSGGCIITNNYTPWAELKGSLLPLPAAPGAQPLAVSRPGCQPAGMRSEPPLPLMNGIRNQTLHTRPLLSCRGGNSSRLAVQSRADSPRHPGPALCQQTPPGGLSHGPEGEWSALPLSPALMHTQGGACQSLMETQ